MKHWKTALGLALSVGLLAWTLRDVEVARILAVLRNANWFYFALSTVAATAIFPLRARRWRPILDPVAPHLPFMPLWRATAIGMAVNNLLPARAGEPARAYVLSREEPSVPFTTAFASLVVDRVFDAVVLLTMLVLAAARFPEGTMIGGQPLSRVTWGAGITAGGAAVVLYLLVFFPALLFGAWDMVAGRLLPRFRDRGRGILEHFANGLGVLRSPTRFASVLFWTVLHWLMNGLAFWLAFQAVGIEAPFSAALFLQALIAIGVALPSSPGFFGIFETVGKVGLALYGVDSTLAVSWALGFHILSFIPITLIGMWFFARLGIHMRDINAASTADAAQPAR